MTTWRRTPRGGAKVFWVWAAALGGAACGGTDLIDGPQGGAVRDAGPPDLSMDGAAPDVSPPVEDFTRVTLETGVLRGQMREGSIEFLGVPFAAPPVGPLRWRPPEAPLPWEGERAAVAMSSPCVQVTGTFVSDDRPDAAPFGDEDCLYLNVWRPEPRTVSERLPVMVFLHGGGNIAGSTQEPLSSIAVTESQAPLYDGARLAARGEVVVVTINYRLGALGFLALPELDAEGATGTSGNYGLMDQIAALEWVQTHIEAFGGDPDRVLLFGQSGGGRDTVLLATSPRTAGLFHAVAIHSAPLGAPTQEPLRERAEDLVQEMGCADASDRLSCMRQVEAGDMVTAEASTPLGLASASFLPTVDGHVVVDQPRTLIGNGQWNPVPMLIGTLSDEYSHRWSGLSEAAYPSAVRAMVGPVLADAVLEQYPLERFSSPTEAFVTLMSDRNVTCPYRVFARVAAASGATAYLYRFSERLEDSARLGYGAYHTSELLFLFQHMEGVHFETNPSNRAAQDATLRFWTRFAATGDPNGGMDPEWPVYDMVTEPYMSISGAPQEGQDLKADDCDFWDQAR